MYDIRWDLIPYPLVACVGYVHQQIHNLHPGEETRISERINGPEMLSTYSFDPLWEAPLGAQMSILAWLGWVWRSDSGGLCRLRGLRGVNGVAWVKDDPGIKNYCA